MKRFLIAILMFSALSAKTMTVDKGQVTLDKIEDYTECQKHDYGGNSCQEALSKWVKQNPKDSFVAGKLTRKHMNAWAAITYFEQAFNEKIADCNDKDVKLAVLSALNLPINRYSEVVASAQKIGLEICFENLKADLQKIETDSYAFKNSCKVLIKKNVLTGLKKNKCAVL